MKLLNPNHLESNFHLHLSFVGTDLLSRQASHSETRCVYFLTTTTHVFDTCISSRREEINDYIACKVLDRGNMAEEHATRLQQSQGRSRREGGRVREYFVALRLISVQSPSLFPDCNRRRRSTRHRKAREKISKQALGTANALLRQSGGRNDTVACLEARAAVDALRLWSRFPLCKGCCVRCDEHATVSHVRGLPFGSRSLQTLFV